MTAAARKAASKQPRIEQRGNKQTFQRWRTGFERAIRNREITAGEMKRLLRGFGNLSPEGQGRALAHLAKENRTHLYRILSSKVSFTATHFRSLFRSVDLADRVNRAAIADAIRRLDDPGRRGAALGKVLEANAPRAFRKINDAIPERASIPVRSFDRAEKAAFSSGAGADPVSPAERAMLLDAFVRISPRAQAAVMKGAAQARDTKKFLQLDARASDQATLDFETYKMVSDPNRLPDSSARERLQNRVRERLSSRDVARADDYEPSSR